MITYYTDGSAIPNPGAGGFAVIKNGRPYIIGSELADSQVSSNYTTNIRMEALAIMAAIKDSEGESAKIITDSEFWINVLTKWAPNWQTNGWRKSKGEIKNLDIVKPLFALYKSSKVDLVWTRGHVGTELNELADEWANIARQRKITGYIKVDELSK